MNAYRWLNRHVGRKAVLVGCTYEVVALKTGLVPPLTALAKASRRRKTTFALCLALVAWLDFHLLLED